MSLASFALRRLLLAMPLLLGVTLLSFFLIVYCGPDITWLLISRDASPEDILRIRTQLGYDQPFVWRYLHFLGQLVTLDFGYAIDGERVLSMLMRTVPVSLLLVLPGFLLGNAGALALALVAARHRGRWVDRAIMASTVLAMSMSLLVITLACKLVFASSAGFGWFPVSGWRVHGLGAYLHHVAVPTLAMVLGTIGYNARFYRAMLVHELDEGHVRTARAYGATPYRLLVRDVLRNAAGAILTRLLFSIPLLLVSGSLILEQAFGIPGAGKLTYDAIAGGDQPVLKAVVSLTAVLLVLTHALSQVLYRALDPRVALR